MNTNEFMKPENLEKYSFLWSEVRLIVAAVALGVGGVPPVFLLPIPVALFRLVSLGLTLAWIISGAASAYLLWRWYDGGQKLFGKKDTRDTVAFFVSIVSGFNLGIVGLTGSNIGMAISSSRFIFGITALIYIIAAVYLYQRWTASGKKLYTN